MTDNICEYCLSIRWDEAPTWRYPAGGSDSRLRIDHRKLQTSACRLCRAFYYDLNITWYKNCLTFYDADADSGFNGSIRFTEESDSLFDSNLVDYMCISLHKPNEIRLAPQYSEHQKLVKRCDELHGSYQVTRCVPKESAQAVQNMYLIDCVYGIVIPAPRHRDYLALSYVWGKASEGGEDYVFPSLPVPLPRTIQDAVTVTKQLGHRYLWVDRYCINQKDGQAKHQQIQQMRAIYEEAELTIIAAAGNGPDHGLPGVSLPRSHVSSKVVQLPSVTLVPGDVNILDEVKNSTWFSRAWTFQESFISRRRLFFGEHVTFLVCAESEHLECDLMPGFRCDKWGFIILERLLPTSGSVLDVHHGEPRGYKRMTKACDSIERYSMRDLTYDSDALNAILGVLDYLAQEDEYPVYHIWGALVCPLYSQGSCTRGLPHCYELAINWYHPEPSRRRVHFPSWSPIAWTGSVSHGNLECLNPVPIIPSDYDVRICRTHDRPSLGTYLASGQLLGDSGRKDAPCLLEFANVRTMPIRLERHSSVIYALLQLDQQTELIKSVFWDQYPVDTNEEQLGMIVTAGMDGEIVIMLLQTRGLHFERTGMILWHYWSGDCTVQDRNTGERKVVQPSEHKLLNPPLFSLERRRNIIIA